MREVSLAAANAAAEKFFESEVLPILRANCFSCHGGEKKIQANLKLTSREAILAGGDSGAAVNNVDAVVIAGDGGDGGVVVTTGTGGNATGTWNSELYSVRLTNAPSLGATARLQHDAHRASALRQKKSARLGA